MSIASDQRPDLETLAAVIACSPIIVARAPAQGHLPAGFEAVDLAILGWIAAEARRLNPRYFRN
jgi:hypothetical protein